DHSIKYTVRSKATNMREGLATSSTTTLEITEASMHDVAERFLALHEFIPAARKKLTDDKWDYMIGGAETETTLKRHRMALDSLGFRPRVPRDGAHIH